MQDADVRWVPPDEALSHPPTDRARFPGQPDPGPGSPALVLSGSTGHRRPIAPPHPPHAGRRRSPRPRRQALALVGASAEPRAPDPPPAAPIAASTGAAGP